MTTFNFSMGVVFLLAGLTGKTQNTDNSRYIEVTVSDTVIMIPDVIEFAISLRQEYDYAAYEATDDYNAAPVDYAAEQKKREEENKLKMKLMEKRFMELLEKEKITYTRAELAPADNMYIPQPSGNIKPFVIKFKSYDQMSKLREKIPEDIRYDADLTNMICSRAPQLEEKLMDKLVVKAKKQADKVAQASGVKTGMMVQFSDNTDNGLVKGVEELVYSFMKAYEREKFMNAQRSMILRKTARVRFAVE